MSIYGFIVGIEKYDEPTWDVSGPAANAIEIANWLSSIGAPRKNIHVFLGLADKQDHRIAPLKKAGFDVRLEVDSNSIDTFWRSEVARDVPAESCLLSFWSGHGFTSKRRNRVFFCSDFTSTALRNRIFNSTEFLNTLLTREFACFSDQIVLADVCGVYDDIAVPDMAIELELFERKQLVFFATPEGKYADGDDGVGVFTRAVLKVLKAQKGWPQQKAFTKALEEAFQNSDVTPFRLSGFSGSREMRETVVGKRIESSLIQAQFDDESADPDKTPSILRLSVTSLGMPSPRPVNLLMAAGVSRLPAIAVTIGLDVAAMAKGFTAIESMLKRIEGEPYVTRTWDVGPPASWGADGARGAVWEVADGTSAEDIWRALATAFSRPHAGCGNVLVMALPSGAQARANALLEMSIKARAAGGLSAGASVPMYVWHSGASEAVAAEPLLGRIRSCIEAGECADDSTDVQAVFRMRLHGGATLAPEWDSADREQIRLHDLSVLSSANGSHTGSIDEMRAVDLITRVQFNQNLLYSLQFLPVSQRLLNSLTREPALTRAVAGLLTPAELQTLRPEWRRPTADGYRSPPALAPSLAG